MPLFTVVIPTYNRRDLVAAAVDSVLQQAFTDLEIIVVDDGSTDDTVQVMEQYRGRLTFLRQENAGAGVARNCAIEQARGDYVAFLDSDDLWLPWSAAVLAQAVREYRQPAFITSVERPFSDPAEIAGLAAQPWESDVWQDYYESADDPRWVPICGTAVRTDVLREVGGFPPQRMNYEETDLWLRLGTARGFVRIGQPFGSARREHPGMVTNDLGRSIRGVEFLMAQERAGRYPGGRDRLKQRLQMLTRHVRPVSTACLRQGRLDDGWRLYRETWRWHVMLGRWKYLLGFPLLARQAARRSARAA